MTKPPSEFAKHRSRRDRLQVWCRECQRERDRKRYAANPERAREYARENARKWRAANPERARENGRKNQRKWIAMPKNREYYRKWNENNNTTIVLMGARKRAKKRGVPCTIPAAYIAAIIPDRCPVFDHKLSRGAGKSGPWSPSLDCILPALGYVPGNVRVISHRANMIKTNATLEELRAVVAWLESCFPDFLR